MITGSVQQKNGKYYAVLNLKDENGKSKQKWINTGYEIRGNKKKAEQFLKEKEMEYSAKEGLISSDMLYAEYVSHWLENHKIKIDEVTYQGYLRVVKGQIIPYFNEKKVKLQDIDADVIQKFVNNRATKGKKVTEKDKSVHYEGLSPKTISNIMIIVNLSLKDAVKRKLIRYNPCDCVNLPKSQKYLPKFFSRNELQKLFTAIREDEMFPIIYSAGVLGLRRSEVLGLKWDSLNFETNTITIKHTVVSMKEIYEKDKTKTEASYREYPMTEEFRKMFLSLKAEEEENRKLFGKEYIENDYIFKRKNGKKYHPDTITLKFSKLLEKNGFEHIRFHDLRHSCASYMINDGCQLKDVQGWLGHADIQTTANIYGHLDIERKKKIAEIMSNTFKI